jgi:phosphoglycerate kinase
VPLFSNIPRSSGLDVEGRRVFVRVDFDVPRSAHGAVLDDRRLREALPVLRQLSARGAKVLVASHYGTKDAPARGGAEGVAARLSELLVQEVPALPKEFGLFAGAMKPGAVGVLPNLWEFGGDAEGDKDTAESIARSIDVYVNEAFRASREPRMSVALLPRYVAARAAGPAFATELDTMEVYLEHPQHPFVAVLGGAHLRAKAPLIKSLLDRAQTILLGGVLANTFLTAKGVHVGRSAVETNALQLAAEILALAEARGVDVRLPLDFVVRDGDDPATLRRKLPGDIRPNDVIIDVAQETCIAYREVLVRARMTVWNGVLGVCDTEDSQSGTLRIAQAMTGTTPYVLALGERTVIQLDDMQLRPLFRYVSGGGDAALDLLRGVVFPGIEALRS